MTLSEQQKESDKIRRKESAFSMQSMEYGFYMEQGETSYTRDELKWFGSPKC